MRSKPAILLVDHGSRRAEANQQLESIAQKLRDRDPQRIVQIAHLEIAKPTIAEGLAACVEAGASEVVVHPYLLAPGRHSREDIPAVSAQAAQAHPGVSVVVSEPLGVHEKLIDVVLERVDAAARVSEQPDAS
jgi:sirohydrochlorin ferrochelatase